MGGSTRTQVLVMIGFEQRRSDWSKVAPVPTERHTKETPLALSRILACAMRWFAGRHRCEAAYIVDRLGDACSIPPAARRLCFGGPGRDACCSPRIGFGGPLRGRAAAATEQPAGAS